MKRFFIILSVFSFISILSAQTPISDLGSYWDSAASNPTLSSKSEYEKYMELSEAIKSGKPGLGEYDDDEALRNGWIALFEDFERYWSDHCPRTFALSHLRKYLTPITETKEVKMNDENSSQYVSETRYAANYTATVSSSFSLKYQEILSIVKAGFVRARKHLSGVSYNWPEISIHSAPEADDEGGSLLVRSYPPKLATVAFTNGTTFFDITVDLTDSSGRTLASSTKNLAGSAVFTFENVSEEDAAKIDAGEISAKLTSLELVYGAAPYVTTHNRTWLEGLPRKQFDVQNARLTNPYSRTKAERNPILETAARVIADEIMVSAGSFSISKTEVTQLFYRSVMNYNPSGFKGDNRPVETVSWFDCLAFCNRLSEITGKTPAYSVGGNTDPEEWDYVPHAGKSIYDEIEVNAGANGFRLPTEEEWLFAARSGTSSDGYEYSGSDEIEKTGWYKKNSGCSGTHPVAQKEPNGLGLFDMTGNVWEWCWDSSTMQLRIAHGGSYSYDDNFCKLSDLYFRRPNMRFDCLGFRIVSR